MQKTENASQWKAWGESDPGKKRENNEDRILCDPNHGIFVVVDGMGGEAAGEVAAQQAVDFIKKRLLQKTGTAARRLREAIAGANNEIFRLAERNSKWRGMACVLTAAIIENEGLHIGHVGDSRLYQIHASTIKKITSDHSPVGIKEDSGELSEADAMAHPRRNEVFRDVGSQLHKPDDEDFIQTLQVPFNGEAAWVICSDGLSDMIPSKEIMRIVVENAGNPKNSALQLIQAANGAGGKDNVSVIVIEGDGFAASLARGHRAIAGANAFARSLVGGRWAFLAYGLVFGLILGLLAAVFLRQKAPDHTPSEVGPSSAIQLPAVLKVEAGSQEYPTISKALDAARPGDRIIVGDGEYEEAIHLKEGVEIAARNPGKAILRIKQAISAEAGIMANEISNAAISGISVKADSSSGLPYGIAISDSNVNISNVEVVGAAKAGILMTGNSSGAISAGYIHENAGPGIIVSGAASPSLVGNLVYANGKSAVQKHPGLRVIENATPEVVRNVFSGNGAEPIRIQKQELKERMMDNLFVNVPRAKAVIVEKSNPPAASK